MNIIYNTAPLDLSDQEQEIRALAPAGIRLSFTTETAEEAEKIAETYARRFLFGEAASMKLPEFTRGLLNGEWSRKIMTKLIIDISKYVLLVLIALYALQSYIIFKKKNEDAREFLFLRQNVLMFAIHFIAFTVFYLKMDESTLFYFYGAQAIYLGAVLVLFLESLPQGFEASGQQHVHADHDRLYHADPYILRPVDEAIQDPGDRHGGGPDHSNPGQKAEISG